MTVNQKVITGEIYISSDSENEITEQEYKSFMNDLVSLVERYKWDCTGSGFKLEDIKDLE